MTIEFGMWNSMTEFQKHTINVNNFCAAGASERLTYFKIMSVLDSDASKSSKIEKLMQDDYLNERLLAGNKPMITKAIELLSDGIKFDYHKFHYKINILEEYSKKINKKGFGI